MLREARTLAAQKGRSNIAFVAADAEVLPFRTGAFDRVTCRIAPHHFPDVCASVAEMVRVTKPGGLVGIIDSVVPEDPALDAFMNGVERVRDPSHVRSYRMEEWVSFLTEAKLTLRYISCAWKEHPFPEWVARTGRPETVQREVESGISSKAPLALRFQPQAIFVSAGFDAHWSDPLTSLGLSTSGFYSLSRGLVELAEEICGGKIICVLEGGYDPDRLADNCLALAAALGSSGE